MGHAFKKSSRGNELQTRLALTADGIFSPDTERKVRAWQAQNDLAADGIVGNANATWAKLFPVPLTGFLIPISLKDIFPPRYQL